MQRRGGWLTAKVGNELVMMSAEKGRYIGLSDVGPRIWELIEPPRSIDELCTQLHEEFDVTPEICRAEVDAFLNELAEDGAVALD